METTDRFLEIAVECPMCGHQHSVGVRASGYRQWVNGTLIQDAFPELTPVAREQLISHLCPACQDLIFGKKETA